MKNVTVAKWAVILFAVLAAVVAARAASHEAVCRTSETIDGCTTLAITTEWQAVDSNLKINQVCFQNWEAAGGGRIDLSLDESTVFVSLKAGVPFCDDKMFIPPDGFDTVYVRGESGGEAYQLTIKGVAQ